MRHVLPIDDGNRVCLWAFLNSVPSSLGMLLCVGVKLGLSHRGWNIGWGFSRIGPEEDIWAYEGWGNGGVEKTAQGENLARRSWLNIRAITSRRTRWARHVTCMGERRSAYKIKVGKTEWRRQLWRLRHRWEDNIKMDLQEVGWGHGVVWPASR